MQLLEALEAGKSTIINLLNRFYEIDSGEILIDNQNIKNYTIANLRKQIAIVLQDVFLFSDSILNNITLHNEAISRRRCYRCRTENWSTRFHYDFT